MCALNPQRKVNDSKGQKAAGGTLSQNTPSIKRKKERESQPNGIPMNVRV